MTTDIKLGGTGGSFFSEMQHFVVRLNVCATDTYK